MPDEVLSRQALNRALLERQMLLRRTPAPAAAADRARRVIEAVEHLLGLQAQAPFPPYYGLWSRLADFRPDELAALITGRQVVRIALMRGTIHLVSARDCLELRPLIQPVLDKALAATYGRQLAGVDTRALAAAGRALTEAEPRTFSELGALLAGQWPGHSPAALAQGVRSLVPLVQVPPRAVWGAAGLARHTPAEAWLGRPLGRGTSLDTIVLRYLAAFGPASVRDAQAWSGLTRLREVTERLGTRLRAFAGPDGAGLLDLPDAPRPDPDVPAPPRFLPEYDNLLLSYAERTRVIPHRRPVPLPPGHGATGGTLLVDGSWQADWKISQNIVEIRPFIRLNPADRDAIAAEGERLLGFADPAIAVRDVRFVPVRSG